jgi:protein toll
MENQNMTEMPGSESAGYQQVTKLYLNDNAIRFVGDLPPNIAVLELQNNMIESLNESVITALNNSQTLQTLKLSGNPWRCDCNFKKFLSFVQKTYMNISDYSDMKCANGQYISQLTASALCNEEKILIAIVSIILAILSLVIGVLAALYYKYQKQIKMWLYSHNLLLWFVTEDDLDRDKTYDAFVSYAHQDGDFITDQLVPHLESCVVPYRLCLHERDWSPGLEISSELKLDLSS